MILVAGHGLAWLGGAGLGKAWQGMAWQGMAGQGNNFTSTTTITKE